MAVVPEFGGDEDFGTRNAALLDGATDGGFSTVARKISVLVAKMTWRGTRRGTCIRAVSMWV